MFTPKQDVQFWAERFKYAKKLSKPFEYRKVLSHIRASNYAQLLTAAFTVLFNERQNKRSYHK